MKPPLRTTLSDVLDQQNVCVDLVHLVQAIASGCWSIAGAVRTSALDGNHGATNTVNVQGEDQKPLDILANDLLMHSVKRCHRLAAAVSEEVTDITWLKPPKVDDFVLAFDPLDGSSNIDVNLSVGTIFSVHRLTGDGATSVLQKGQNTVCAGYAIYGPSTMLVVTFGRRVDGFTLDEAADDFILTHPDMRIPEATQEFAINASRARHWHPPISKYVADCTAGAEGPRGKSFNMRWTASMVADMHRILTRGGVFLYPADGQNQFQGGKLRLMYEAIPMAMITSAAGGAATNGQTPILDIIPTDPHQRVAVVLGSADEVAQVAAAYG